MQKKKKKGKSLKRPIKNKRWDKIKVVIGMVFIEVAADLIISVFENILQMVFPYLF